MLNNILVVPWQTNNDTTWIIFTLYPDRWFRVRKDWMTSTNFVNTIVSWQMRQGSANIERQMILFWIKSYNIYEYHHTILVYIFRSWNMSQGSVNIGWQIKYLWIQSYSICESRRNKCNIKRQFMSHKAYYGTNAIYTNDSSVFQKTTISLVV